MQAAEERKRGQEECYAYYTLTCVSINSLKASRLYLLPNGDLADDQRGQQSSYLFISLPVLLFGGVICIKKSNSTENDTS